MVNCLKVYQKSSYFYLRILRTCGPRFSFVSFLFISYKFTFCSQLHAAGMFRSYIQLSKFGSNLLSEIVSY